MDDHDRAAHQEGRALRKAAPTRRIRDGKTKYTKGQLVFPRKYSIKKLGQKTFKVIYPPWFKKARSQDH